VAVTATTGMAALQLSDLDAKTIHSWSGIKRGNKSDLDVFSEIEGNNPDAVARIKSTEVLVIDEIGMMSRRIFEQLNYVLCKVKQTNVIFGGLQVITAGSFKQLPPVPNLYIGDAGEYLFQSDMFRQVFPHHIHLTSVKRQHEGDLIMAVQELCDGCTSPTTDNLMQHLSRPVEPEPENVQAVFLVGTNLSAALINGQMLEEADAKVAMDYKSSDAGVSKLH
jgi:hypothetical protein